MQFRRIVIGVDFTDASLAAARWAAMQLAPRAEVILVHALPDPRAPSYLRPALPSGEAPSTSLAPVFYGGLQGLSGLIGAGRTRVHMAAGDAADVLATAAAALDADLVCVGRGARRRGSARFGATTAIRVMSRAHVPVVTVPPGNHDAPGRIVVAVDDRPGTERLLDVACGLAASHEARVVALHAVAVESQEIARRVHDLAHAAGAPRRPDDGDEDAWLRALARGWVETLLARADAPPGRTTAAIALGDAGQQVVAHVAATGADLVVVGRGGDHAGDRGDAVPAGPTGRHQVGSTARLVSWVAPCPVLVVPPARSAPSPSAWAVDAVAAGRREAGC